MLPLSERDRSLIWHPFTQEKTAPLPLAIARAKGSYLYDTEDKAYLDLISSWWVTLHGHAHPVIARHIYAQALRLEQVIFAGFTHAPAVEICTELKMLLPPPLGRFFFSDNGSTSVEVALKMAYQYWHNKGETERKLFLSFEGGYHGDTFGAMSVGRSSGFHKAFLDLCFEVLNLPFPATWDDDSELTLKEEQALEALDIYLETRANKIAAFILEPLVQGAAGMRLCRPAFLRKLLEHARTQGILLIFDEVMTGFGRTGTYFALEQIGVVPDILCLSKGLTGGFLPLALTVTTEAIYEAFLHREKDYAFAHGHSYTANPLACAAALASLRLLQKEETHQALQILHAVHKEGLEHLKIQCPRSIAKIRLLGTISAFDLREAALSPQILKNKMLEKGFILRPLGNSVYLLPPFGTPPDALKEAYTALGTLL